MKTTWTVMVTVTLWVICVQARTTKRYLLLDCGKTVELQNATEFVFMTRITNHSRTCVLNIVSKRGYIYAMFDSNDISCPSGNHSARLWYGKYREFNPLRPHAKNIDLCVRHRWPVKVTEENMTLVINTTYKQFERIRWKGQVLFTAYNTGYCNSNSFKCQDGYCIDKDLVEDSYENCRAGADEAKWASATPPPSPGYGVGHMTGVVLSVVCASLVLLILLIVSFKVRRHLLMKRRQPTLAVAQNYQNQTTAHLQAQQYQVNPQGLQEIPLHSIQNQQPGQVLHGASQPQYATMPPSYDEATGGNKQF